MREMSKRRWKKTSAIRSTHTHGQQSLMQQPKISNLAFVRTCSHCSVRNRILFVSNERPHLFKEKKRNFIVVNIFSFNYYTFGAHTTNADRGTWNELQYFSFLFSKWITIHWILYLEFGMNVSSTSTYWLKRLINAVSTINNKLFTATILLDESESCSGFLA